MGGIAAGLDMFLLALISESSLHGQDLSSGLYFVNYGISLIQLLNYGTCKAEYSILCYQYGKEKTKVNCV